MKTKILLTLTQNQNNMKRLFLVFTILFCITLANAQNPFEAYGYTPKIATLSNGKYNEFHDLDTVVQIGTVLFNTQTKQIVAFLQIDTLYSEATLQPDIVSMWLSPDPLSDEYPSWSPYAYCANNPIFFIDPDGRDIVPTNEAGNMAVTSYLNNFSVKTQNKAFGLYPTSGNDPKSGAYPIYSSINKGAPYTQEKFTKLLGKEGKKMSATELNEAYSFYLGLASESQYKVEGWAPASSFTTGTEVQGSEIVDVVPGYAPREVNNNRHLENDLYETNFDKIFNPNRTSSDSRNKFEDGFNFYQNYVKNPQNLNDRNTRGVIVIDTRNSNWQNILGRAFQSVIE